MDHQVILTFMFLIFLIVVNLKGMQWYHIAVIFISLMIKNVEYIFICFFTIWVSFLLRYLWPIFFKLVFSLVLRSLLRQDSGFTSFFLALYQFLLHVVSCSTVECIQIKDCYVFFENISLYHYVMPYFSPYSFP